MRVDKELREMIRAVNNYIVLISNEEQDELKRNCNNYIKDVTNLQSSVDEFINQKTHILYIWCLYNADNFSAEGNFIFKIKKFFRQIISNHYMNLYSYELSIAGLLQEHLNAVLMRLNHYKYLLHCN